MRPKASLIFTFGNLEAKLVDITTSYSASVIVFVPTIIIMSFISLNLYYSAVHSLYTLSNQLHYTTCRKILLHKITKSTLVFIHLLLQYLKLKDFKNIITSGKTSEAVIVQTNDTYLRLSSNWGFLSFTAFTIVRFIIKVFFRFKFIF